jgi:uncharacterized phiE125 gp8 family phage protein
MKIVVATAPVLEPITVDELSKHIKQAEGSYGEEYTLLEDYIKTARGHVETITRRKLLTSTWDYYLDVFPSDDYFKLPFGNLATVTHVKYTDSGGTQTTMTVTTEYLVEINGDQCGFIVLPYGVTWPSFTAYTSHPIVIRFVCGWTAASSIPFEIRTAVKMIAAKLYEGRGEDIIGQTVAEDKFYLNLLQNYRLWDDFE